MKSDPWPTSISLLADLVVFESYGFEEFLRRFITLIHRLVPVDSCLIYMRDSSEKTFTLIASSMPHVRLLGKVTLQTGEGITGWVAEHKKTVVIKKGAYKDSRFKHIKELPEDTYEAFLSVPILGIEGTIGVINLQNREPYGFLKKDIQIIESIMKLIASAFAKVTLQKEKEHLADELLGRKVIEKAKGILMKEKKLSESAAYEFIRKEAMKKRKTKKEIAEAILLVW